MVMVPLATSAAADHRHIRNVKLADAFLQNGGVWREGLSAGGNIVKVRHGDQVQPNSNENDKENRCRNAAKQT
jgi:hypothetical protein